VAAAAEAHVERCQIAYDAAQQVVDGIAERASAAIVEQLERGEAPSTPTATAKANWERTEAARADLEQAMAARDEVAARLGPAELAVIDAEVGVKEAARGVIRRRIADLRMDIDGLTAQAEAHRKVMNALLVCLVERRWPVPWPAAAEALLHDPEAALDEPAA
jgi:hypothetical protein